MSLFSLSLCPTPARFLFLRPGPSREARIHDDSCGFWTLLFPDARLHNDFQGVGHDPNSRNQAYPGLCRAYVPTGQYSVNKFGEVCPAKRPKSSDFGGRVNPSSRHKSFLGLSLCLSVPLDPALKPHSLSRIETWWGFRRPAERNVSMTL